MPDLSRTAQQTLGGVTKELLENPLFTGAVTQLLSAREKAVAAQEVAMSGLNIPSAADIERLTRRLRSVSQRLEGIEDQLDGVAQGRSTKRIEDRLEAIEAQLSEIAGALAAAPAATASK